MKIIVLSNFPSILDGEPNGRFSYLSTLLHDKGHNVELIVSDFDHAKKKHRVDLHNLYPFNVTFIHEPGYNKNISLKRLWSHFVWGRNVRTYLQALKYTPDLIYVALPTYTAGYYAANYCKKTQAKFVVDIQDIWPDAFELVVIPPFRFLLKPMEWYVNRVYRAADFIVGVSDTFMKRGLRVNRKCNKGLTVYLGNSAIRFDESREKHQYEKIPNVFQLAYVGTMGYSYDLKCVIDAVRKVTENKKNGLSIKFIAIGNGPRLEEFQLYAAQAGINYEFTGYLPYEEMVGKLCSCDVVVNCIAKGASQSITNKVGDYALSGLPVINTQENMEYRQLVERYQCGINCRCGNSDDVADAIITLINNPEKMQAMGENSRRLGIKQFDRVFTYPQIINMLEQLVNI